MKKVLPLLLLSLLMVATLSTEAKSKKSQRTVYYIVCGSYPTQEEAIRHADEMSEVVFYNVYKATANGKTVYRLCCDCYYSKADAEKDLEGILSGFKGYDWWIWPSKGLAKCVYRPYSPKGNGERMPNLKPHTKAMTE